MLVSEALEKVAAGWKWKNGERKAFIECEGEETHFGKSFFNLQQAHVILSIAEYFIELVSVRFCSNF